MKIKLFIDFDKTLFDTGQVKQRLDRIFGQFGFSQDEIEQTYLAESLDGKFNPYGQIEKLAKIRQFNTQTAEMKTKSMIFDANSMLYSDSAPFIENIDKDKYEVNLLSFGDVQFQSKKVEHSGLADLFDNCYYTDIEKYKYLEDLVDKDEYFIVIDDREEALEKISAKFPKSFMILITRDANEIAKSYRIKGARVRNLKQAEQYL